MNTKSSDEFANLDVNLQKIIKHPENRDMRRVWRKWVSAGVSKKDLGDALLALVNSSKQQLRLLKPSGAKEARRFAKRLEKDADEIQHRMIQFSSQLSLGPRNNIWVRRHKAHDVYLVLPELLREFAKDICNINYLEQKQHRSKDYYRQALEDWIVDLRLSVQLHPPRLEELAPGKKVRLIDQAATLINGVYLATGSNRIVDTAALQKRLYRLSLRAHLLKHDRPRGTKPEPTR